MYPAIPPSFPEKQGIEEEGVAMHTEIGKMKRPGSALHNMELPGVQESLFHHEDLLIKDIRAYGCME